MEIKLTSEQTAKFIKDKYIDIQWAKINSYQSLCDFEISFCILYIHKIIIIFIF